MAMHCPRLAELPPPPEGKTGWPWTVESPQLPDTTPDGRPWPRISIVTPSYNQGQFIEETIRSVLLQGYPDLEYIIMDGGSTDGAVDIIRKYERWLTHWQSGQDGGFAAALNCGFRLTSGQILGWINSDDGYMPSSLGTVSMAVGYRSGRFVFGNSIVLSERETRFVRTGPVRKIYRFLGGIIPQHAAFWTMDIHVDLDERIKAWIDLDLWIRMLPLARKIVRVNKDLAYINIHKCQKTRTSVIDGKGKSDDEYIARKYGKVRTSVQYMVVRHLYLLEARFSKAVHEIRSRYFMPTSQTAQN